ncbi:tryptophan 2,3-dioxygenase-like [Watersipora subatra]|uniref:tryptophan 2,3-dioxygenase-like n=1 Tax=Watersipora subatra TaxID=2589382 RepID=UPI00355B3EE9
MACPYSHTSVVDGLNGGIMSGEESTDISTIQNGLEDLAVSPVHTYHSFLELDKLLTAQNLKSQKPGGGKVHDEHLFIVTHQAFELWFKQILYELDSVKAMLNEQRVDERMMLLIITRLNRVNVIMKLLCDQFSILETMTPLDFMEFRTVLGTSSGFQSLQFRLLENSLGIKDENRVRYNQQYYKAVFNDPISIKMIEESESQPSLLQLIEKWLERTPGLSQDEFHFWNKYKVAVNGWLKNDFLKPAEEETDPAAKRLLMAEYLKTKDSFDGVLDEEKYSKVLSRGERRISYEAFQGAVMINMYRDEPRFHQPFQMLTMLQDLDSHFTKWRYSHVMLVQRMIGSKVGTGGSSGYQYLRSTISDRYKVFIDLFNVSTYLVPRSYIPPLTSRMKKTLSMMLHTPSDLALSATVSTSSTECLDEHGDANDNLEEDSPSAVPQFVVGSI